jgi:uncharacterized protein involved in type VI secretion and phage assembly
MPAANGKATYRSLPTVEIGGQPAPQNLMDDIVQIVVEESLHLTGMFTLVVQNDYQAGRTEDKPWRYQELLQVGKPIKIGFKASTTEAKEFSQEGTGMLIEGEITAIETHFSDRAQAPVIVRGYDTSHRLHRGQHNRSFQSMTDTDIVKKIAGEVGIVLGEVDPSGEPYEYVFQPNQTNMEFLRERARRIGFELFNQDGKLHFRKPKAKEELSLKWLKELHSFRVRVTSAEQVQAVEVRSWDYHEKRAIVATAQAEQILTQTENGKGSATSSKFNGKPPTPKRLVSDSAIASPKEADAMAQAVCNEIAGQFVSADAKAEGNPKLRPGRVIKLEGMGSHSGKYYITETRHLYAERVYATEFCVRGLRGGDLLTTLAPQTPLRPGHTPIIGIVTNNKDPKGLGRVKVKFPTLTESHTSNWARVVSVGAGGNCGFDSLPEINDEVLVTFEQGDIHRPYVIGGVWNGKSAPPAHVSESIQDSTVRLRTMRTPTGHQLQFSEKPKGSNAAGICLKTAGGHQLFLNDTTRTIELQTASGQKIVLNDGTGAVSFSSNGSLGMETQGAMGLQGTTVSIGASGAITITGSAITLTGGTVTIVTPAKTTVF